MAHSCSSSSSPSPLLVTFCCYFLILLTSVRGGFDDAVVIPITKDSNTLQYIAKLQQGTPPMPMSLTVDLGGPLTWVDCSRGYKSSTYGAAQCGLAPCASFGPDQTCGDCHSRPNPRPGCNNNTCSVVAQNPITGNAAKGLAKEARGVVGFGNTRPALLSQFDGEFSDEVYQFPLKFAICLTRSNTNTGFAIFGKNRYVLLPGGIDVSKSLKFTPVVRDPEGSVTEGYYFNVTAIKINGKEVNINKPILTKGGTKISTIHPYTVLETSIFNAVTKAFTKALNQVRQVNPVKPFSVCYEAKGIGSTRVGPAVPNIDLVMHKKSVYWRIFGVNSMVQVNKDVMCLGFVDGGAQPGASIIIGGYQLEDNLVEFDRLNGIGFSSSLLFRQTSCTNFNFTVMA